MSTHTITDAAMHGRPSASPARRVQRAIEGWKTAADCIGTLTPDTSLFVLTRGQISMIDAIRECVRQLAPDGPTAVSVWTWCIADYEVEAFEWFLNSGDLCGARLVIDRSAEHRNAGLIDRWRDTYGTQNVRVCMNHAKIATVANPHLRVSLRGSMNLNYNPRFEQFDLSVNDPTFDLIRDIESSLPVLPRLAPHRDAEIATGVCNAFTTDQLTPFQGIRTWQK